LTGLDPDVRRALPRFFGGVDPGAPDPIAAARHRLDALAAYGPPVRGEVASRDADVTGPSDRIRVRAYSPSETRGPAIVFFHGGGWTSGSIESHDVICRALCAALGASVVAVDYRLAPEHPFPAAVEDAWSATVAVADDPGRFDASQAPLVVAGDSVGGALAAVVARRARDRGLALAGHLLAYPVADLPSDRPSYRSYAEGFGLTRQAMEQSWRAYLGDGGDGGDDVAPLRSDDLAGVAPAVVVTAECDVLRDEGEEYARRLRDAGVAVAQRRYGGLVHGFLRIAGEVDAARSAFDDMVTLAAATLGYDVGQPAGRGTA
jgi:acetyl esterase